MFIKPNVTEFVLFKILNGHAYRLNVHEKGGIRFDEV